MAASASMLIAPSQLPYRGALPATTASSSSSRQLNWPPHSCFPHSHSLPLQAPAFRSWTGFNIAESSELLSSPRTGILLSATVRADDGGVETAADAEKEHREETGLAALEQLDSQLRALSQGNDTANNSSPSSSSSLSSSWSSSSTSASSRISCLQGKAEEIQPMKDSDTATEWPEFSEGFMASAGIGLLILTAVVNVLYAKFVEPPLKPQRSEKVEAQLRELRMRKFSKNLSGNLKAPLAAPDPR